MNRLSQQSEEQIFQAFFELLHTQPLKEISVKSICALANISRKTFYIHFTSKNEIIKKYFETKFDSYVSGLQNQNFQGFKDVVIYYFYFWEKYENVIKLLIQKNLITEFFVQSVNKLSEIYFNLNIPLQSMSQEANIQFAGYFFSGGLQNTYIHWLKDGKPNTPEVMATFLIETLKKIN